MNFAELNKYKSCEYYCSFCASKLNEIDDLSISLEASLTGLKSLKINKFTGIKRQDITQLIKTLAVAIFDWCSSFINFIMHAIQTKLLKGDILSISKRFYRNDFIEMCKKYGEHNLELTIYNEYFFQEDGRKKLIEIMSEIKSFLAKIDVGNNPKRISYIQGEDYILSTNMTLFGNLYKKIISEVPGNFRKSGLSPVILSNLVFFGEENPKQVEIKSKYFINDIIELVDIGYSGGIGKDLGFYKDMLNSVQIIKMLSRLTVNVRKTIESYSKGNIDDKLYNMYAKFNKKVIDEMQFVCAFLQKSIMSYIKYIDYCVKMTDKIISYNKKNK